MSDIAPHSYAVVLEDGRSLAVKLEVTAVGESSHFPSLEATLNYVISDVKEEIDAMKVYLDNVLEIFGFAWAHSFLVIENGRQYRFTVTLQAADARNGDEDPLDIRADLAAMCTRFMQSNND